MFWLAAAFAPVALPSFVLLKRKDSSRHSAWALLQTVLELASASPAAR